MKKYSSKKGYTLIELVVVAGILVVISMLVTGVLYSILRGSSKSTVTNNVAQNGNYALSTMTNIILTSNDIVTVGLEPDFSNCTTPQTGTSITMKRVDGGETTLICAGGLIASQSATGDKVDLINASTVALVGGTCSFTCTQPNLYAPPVIDIEFSLSDKGDSQFAENISSALFQTRVLLRNYMPQ